MAETVASTAYGPMVLTALERTLLPSQRIIDDLLAYRMLPSGMKLMVQACHFKPVRQLFVGLMEKSMPGLLAGFVSRKRYINDKMLESLNIGIEAVVILGAGLDTLAYRIPQLASVKVYEVDLPENIHYKERQLKALFGAVPAHVTLVSINFEDQNLNDVLQQAGYSFDYKTAFVWEAVTQYLSESAVRETFQALAKAKSGSRLLFTYVLQEFIDGTNTFGLESLYQRFRIKSDLWKFGLHPEAVGNFIADYGWRVLEQVGANEYSSRYLHPVGRSEPVAVIERIVYALKL